METIHFGFFAIRDQQVGRLRELRARWSESVDRMADDSALLYNNLYCTAREVAEHWAQRDGESIWSASVAMLEYLRRSCRIAPEKGVLSPGELRSFAQGVARLEKRAGGPEQVVQRLARRDRRTEPAAYATVYQAFREVLAYAVDHELGMTWGVLDDDAEANLAQQRRQHQEMLERGRKLAEELARRPPAPEPTEEQRREESARAAWRDINEQRLHEPLWLFVLPDPLLQAERSLIEQGYLMPPRREPQHPAMPPYDPAALHDMATLRTRACRRLRQRAADHAVLRKKGEQELVDNLRATLSKHCGRDMEQRPGLFTSDQVAAMHAAFLAWEQQQGDTNSALQALHDHEIHWHTAHTAYQAWKRILAAAAESGHGLAMLEARAR